MFIDYNFFYQFDVDLHLNNFAVLCIDLDKGYNVAKMDGNWSYTFFVASVIK